jgi:hypothetical protein
MFRAAILVLTLCSSAGAFAASANAFIDSDGFRHEVAAAMRLREERRIPEEEFIRMAGEPGTVVLDARSDRLYQLRHVKGAVNLSFPEFTAETLARAIPSRATRILIYCNNNFRDLPESMPTKVATSALNLSTFTSLYAYGYREIYELGPVVDPARTNLVFEGDELREAR